MKLIVIILNKVEMLNELLSIMVEAGITRATIIDSQGLGKHLAYEMPIFAGLRNLIGEADSYNKTILALIDDDKVINEFKSLTKSSDIDFSSNGAGIFFVVPVESVVRPTVD